MKESTEIEEKLPDKKHEDAVLKYLAENHPDDENALSEMTALLDSATDSQALLDAVYRGTRSEQNAKDAENAGYLRGKNEAIEMAVNAGAKRETVEIIEVEDVPLAYYPGNTCRVKVKSAGELR